MKIIITKGPHTDQVIQKAYSYMIQIYRKNMLAELKEGKTVEKYINELEENHPPND